MLGLRWRVVRNLRSLPVRRAPLVFGGWVHRSSGGWRRFARLLLLLLLLLQEDAITWNSEVVRLALRALVRLAHFLHGVSRVRSRGAHPANALS